MCWTTLLVLAVIHASVLAATKPGERTPDQLRYRATAGAELPYITYKVHRVGNLGLNISNTGYLGDRKDYCTGLPIPSLEFPINSGVEYNYAGGIWVGAVSGGDTLVSLAITGGSGVGADFFPRKYPEGDIIERTTRPILRQPAHSNCPDVTYSKDAVSEQDFVAMYCDTLGQDLNVGGDRTGRERPLGIEVSQKSYSWSTEYARDFVLIEMSLKNVSRDTLHDLYMGLFMDQDVWGPGGTYDDDITGFTQSVPSPVGHGYLDTVNLAWIADNDGDPREGSFESWCPTGVTGVRVVQAPGNLQFAFNWWISNASTARDWGPNKRDTKVTYSAGNLGTPNGRIEHYQIMSNGEFDYPQWETAIDHSLEGWLPPVSNPALAADLANGFDTRYLLSFGPFVMRPDSVLPLTFAVIAGENFHVDPYNYAHYFDANNPGPWLANLNQSDFALNALWAGWVYDSPGYDTDGDGYRGKFRVVDGDTAFYTGDGVADYQGPPAPPAPSVLKYTTQAHKITIRFNGHNSETARDPFSFIPDFEGYRVYISRTLQLSDFALLTSRDNINYVRRKYQPASNRWLVTNPPFTLDSLKTLYDALSDSTRGFPFHPDSYSVCTVPLALREIILDPVDPSKLDTNFYCFHDFEANAKVNDTTTAYEVDSLGHDVVGVIRKVYPYAKPTDSLVWLPDGTVLEWPYYEYEYAIDGLQLAEPVYLAVTTFDFGSPAADLSPLESSPLANATEIWPVNSAAVVKSDRPTPGVYPNPYRLADAYNETGWENPRNLEPDAERARKVTFTNIPDTCTISVWSLDGDLVRRLDHAEPSGSSQATVAVWNLITRNTQAVKTGIYLYTIESRFGTDVGKLVIIK
jgi:hypothetical protein